MSKYPEQVREDARKAADYIREHGWSQETPRESKDGPCCALGAIWSVCGNQSEFRTVELESALRKEIGNIPRWNDTPGRTKEEVLEVFDRIANS